MQISSFIDVERCSGLRPDEADIGEVLEHYAQLVKMTIVQVLTRRSA